MTTPKNPAAVALGKLGGKATSQRKAVASRLNGQKGGRPKKEEKEGQTDGMKGVERA